MKIVCLKRHWRLVGANGKTLAHSEQYANHSNAVRAGLKVAQKLILPFHRK